MNNETVVQETVIAEVRQDDLSQQKSVMDSVAAMRSIITSVKPSVPSDIRPKSHMLKVLSYCEDDLRLTRNTNWDSSLLKVIYRKTNTGFIVNAILI